MDAPLLPAAVSLSPPLHSSMNGYGNGGAAINGLNGHSHGTGSVVINVLNGHATSVGVNGHGNGIGHLNGHSNGYANGIAVGISPAPPPVTFTAPSPPPTRLQRLYRFVHHPITSGIITVASTAGLVAAAILTNVPGVVVSTACLGYFGRTTAGHMSQSSNTALRTIADTGSLVNRHTTFEVFFGTGILALSALPNAVIAATGITCVMFGKWGRDYIAVWTHDETPPKSHVAGEGPVVEDLDTGKVLPPLRPQTTAQRACEFVRNNKGSIFATVTGTILFLSGVRSLSASTRVFAWGGNVICSYGLRMIGGVAGRHVEPYLHRLKDANPTSTCAKALYTFVNMNKVVIATSVYFIQTATTDIGGVIPCLFMGAATGASYSQQSREFIRIEKLPLEPEGTGCCIPRTPCAQRASFINKLVVTSAFIGGGLYFLFTTNYDDWVTSNADAGTLMCVIPIAFFITKIVDRGLNDSWLKQQIRFFLQYCPTISTAEYQWWNALLVSETLTAEMAQYFVMMLANAGLIGLTYGAYRCVLNRTLLNQRASPQSEQMYWTHFRSDLLVKLLLSLFFPQQSS